MTIGLPKITQEDVDKFIAQQRTSFFISSQKERIVSDIITKSINLSRSMVSWDLGAKFMKLQEEMGEFAEVALYESGYNQHKNKPDEDSFGEGADVILCVLDTLSRLHMNMTGEQVADALDAALLKKYTKWETRILDMERRLNDRSSQDQQLPSNSK